MTEANDDLGELLEETRILLPGAELLAAFLIPLPFTERFERLESHERTVFLFAFIATIVALACFLTPAAYHRIARPIRDKAAFKKFANRFIVVGLAPFSISLPLVAYLVTAVVTNTVVAMILSGFVSVLVLVLWWVIPYARLHRRESSAPSTR